MKSLRISTLIVLVIIYCCQNLKIVQLEIVRSPKSLEYILTMNNKGKLRP